jgi:CheY-like chemotaxis protein
MVPSRLVLLVEDNDDHAELVRRAFSRRASDHELLRLASGEQALAYLSSEPRQSWPDLVLLDLRLPRISGLDVLRGIKQLQGRPALPVVIWTTSDNQLDVASAYTHGASGYIVKPSDLLGFEEAVQDLTRFWLRWNYTAGRDNPS